MPADTSVESLNTLCPWLAPEEWEPRLAGVPLPFRKVGWAISGFKASAKLDVQDAPGESGATIKFRGYQLARGTITLSCWSQEGWDLVQALIEKVRPRRQDKTPPAFDVFDPRLSLIDVTRIIVESVSPPQVSDAKLMTVELEAVEYAPAPRVPKKSAASASATKVAAPGDLLTSTGTGEAFGPPLPPIGPPLPPSKTKPTP